MTRWFPAPLLSVVILIIWLLLNQSVAPAHLLLGALLAIVVPLLTQPLRPMKPAVIKKPLVMVRLLSMALVEIIRSCFNVSRIILFTEPKGLRSQFMRIPLDLKSPYGLALLSCLINTTPGTVWVEILPDSNDLALHVFDLQDEQWWIDTIKTRYEQPLIEIFD